MSISPVPISRNPILRTVGWDPVAKKFRRNPNPDQPPGLGNGDGFQVPTYTPGAPANPAGSLQSRSLSYQTGQAAADTLADNTYGVPKDVYNSIAQERIKQAENTLRPRYVAATQEAINRGVYRGEPLSSAYGTIEKDFADTVRGIETDIGNEALRTAFANRQAAINTANTVAGQQAENVLRSRAQRETERQFDVSQSGILDGERTLAGRSQLEAEKSGGAQRDLAIIQAFGDVPYQTEQYNLLPGQRTLGGRAQGLTEEIERGRLGLAGRAQTEEERRNQAIERLQARGIAVTEANLAEEMRQFDVNQEAVRAGLTGRLGGEKTLAARELTQRGQIAEADIVLRQAAQSLADRIQTGQLSIAQAAQGLADRIQTGQLSIAQAAQGLDEKVKSGQLSIAQRDQIMNQVQLFGKAVGMTGQVDERGIPIPVATTLGVRGGLETEESRRNRAAEGLQSRGVTVTEKSLDEEVRRNTVQEIIQARGMTLEERKAEITKDMTMRGQDIDNARINAEIQRRDRELSQREQEMYGGTTVKNADGTLTFHQTMAYQNMTARQKFAYAELAEMTRRNMAQEDAAWQERTGISVGVPGTIAFSDFSKDMGKTSGFDPKNDFNNDGKVDFEDYFIGVDQGKIVPNNTTMTTVQRDQVNSNVKQAAAAIDMDEKEFELKSAAFMDSIARWKSDFTGVLYDEKGQAFKETEEPVFEGKEVLESGFDWDKNTGIFPNGMRFTVKGNQVFEAAGGGYIGDVEPSPDGGLTVRTPFGINMPLDPPQYTTRQVQTGTRTRRDPITGVQLQQLNQRKTEFEADLAERIRKFDADLALTQKQISAQQKQSLWSKIGNIAKIAVGAGAMLIPGGQAIGAGILGSR